MNKEKIIEKAKSFVRDLLSKEGSGHGYDHVQRVLYNAEKILQTEEADPFVVRLAAILHDVDDYKLFPDHQNDENARAFLKEAGVDEETAEKVIACIDTISFKGKDSVVPQTMEGKIVQDADRLDAIGAIGIARAFAYGGSQNRRLYDDMLLFRKNPSFKEYRSGSPSTIAHFYEKLLLLKDMMNTEKGKEIAEERHAYMLTFLDEFAKETGHGK